MLEIKNLSVSIQDKLILDNLSLSVNTGEVAAIMGPNGSGKSTLAYVIAGKPGYEVTSGKILLDIDPIAKVWAILAKLLEQRDHLGDLLLAQDRQLQIEEFAALGQPIVPSLRGEDQYDQIEGRYRRCARQPYKGRRIGRAIAKREGEAVQAHPADDASSQRCDETGAAQQRCEAVDDSLMVCGVRTMLGVKRRDRLDGFLNMERKDR